MLLVNNIPKSCVRPPITHASFVIWKTHASSVLLSTVFFVVGNIHRLWRICFEILLEHILPPPYIVVNLLQTFAECVQSYPVIWAHKYKLHTDDYQ